MKTDEARANGDTDLRHAFRQGMLDVRSKGDHQMEDAKADGGKSG